MTELTIYELKKSYFNDPDLGCRVDSPVVLKTPESRLTNASLFVLCEARKLIASNSENVNFQEEDIFQLVKRIEEEERVNLTDLERDVTLHALLTSLTDYDVLTSLVEDSSVNDIIVKSYDDISYQVKRKNIQSDISFPSERHYKSFIERLLKQVGKSCTTATPVVDAALEPHVRVCVTHESFSPSGSGPMLTMRLARHASISIKQLLNWRFASEEVLEYLTRVVEAGEVSVLIAGEVGTGKTTLVRALCGAIPEDEAILCIEDTHEINLSPRRFVRTLLTREANTEGAGRIQPYVAIRTGMRMAMNRIILGEMRDSDAAEAFIDVCSSGHSGMSTIHARSANDALARLELLLLRGVSGVNEHTVRKQISNAISVVVFLKVDPVTGHRKVDQILEVQQAAEGIIQSSSIFRFVYEKNCSYWLRDSGVSTIVGGLPAPGKRFSFEFIEGAH